MTGKRGRPAGTGVASRAKAQAMSMAEVKPLEVMLKVMCERWRDAEDARAAGDREVMLGAQGAAFDCAKDIAPYIHPRLQAMTLKGDKENPLQAVLGIYSTEQLKAAVRGVK
jgi:hypothetical protein